ncbi:MAG: 1-deoxy-D-xylulose-5-phosphate reductoisomerase [Anaerovibrio sp.]|uniref:1-deoxy-D-xylulose-5-phosphate reductoisomerase n=1 Tax=Anaerovibrio sp. TaxID=1872532 RepID=UPI0025CC54D6|nr:1-deoxy-D-xylulose-5-phosphate reductoisomerase [Anaerovibrio sp.]MCR5175284.1 1-deoxy-D-xylulose-5-phosphate reductoisomerase [Anaerovibrio sp.]
MKNLVILGSTGSIGTQTLDVVRENPGLFHISVLVANTSDELIEKQIMEFKPELAVLSDNDAAERLKSRYSGPVKIQGGRQAVLEAAVYPDADVVVTSLMGFAGLEPTLAALDAHKDIALANKETLVVAGELVMAKAREKGCAILPVDSEHCALFQCLQGQDRKAVEKLILTASGGPFRGKKTSDLTNVTKKDVLAHPTWNMGQKITVDSASLVNKGLEVIEAKWLYGVSYDQIQVVVHPQSIVHSMIQYHDGTVMAQLGCTDMRLPIQYALTYPDRVKSHFPRVDFYELGKLTFEKPDMETFRGLKLAFEAGRTGGTMPCVMNAANEVAVGAFLKGEAGFLKIYDLIENAMDKAKVEYNPSLEQLLEADRWAREITQKELSK